VQRNFQRLLNMAFIFTALYHSKPGQCSPKSLLPPPFHISLPCLFLLPRIWCTARPNHRGSAFHSHPRPQLYLVIRLPYSLSVRQRNISQGRTGKKTTPKSRIEGRFDAVCIVSHLRGNNTRNEMLYCTTGA